MASGIYLVLDSNSTAGRPLEHIVEAAVAGGITTIQLRCKDMPAGEFVDTVESCAKHTSGRAALLVNDRIDVYLAARARGADVQGVHIGQSDIPADLVRTLIGPHAVLGLSASTADEIDTANELNAFAPGTVDYLGVGAVHATPTKKDHPEPLGYGGLAAAAARSTAPVVAIGGLDTTDVPAIRSAGAASMAVVRAICAADDPRTATAHLISLWEGETP
ncbi:thiamine phosphate synthase [Paeniglutamicibacter psychrophenolicus]|uniref:thiamine phosphate synthase n=1 Tax=Paeniglutamicibacter psychrophenolicus TaxID=257454 RepID=UPI002784428A|nr:thiamine phosphate synthase [Paeniglutamicibacter psychrophenolicus]MDQ0095052.1 thiamine-phosphate diphosphorylase [Paeniglutamicibacter psychrophenolicus]